MKNNTGGGRGCFGRRPTWDQKQRWMRDECDENPTVNSMPRGLKYSAGHSHDDDLDSVVLVGVVGVSNASSLGRLSLVKSSFDHDLPATWISPQRPWRYHDRANRPPTLVPFSAHSPPTRRRSGFMPRGTTPAHPTTNAAVIPARWPLPSIEPGRTRMGDTLPISFWAGSNEPSD